MLSEILIGVLKARERRRTARMSRAEFEAFKLNKFRRLAKHVAARSPYYARLIRDRGIDVHTCHPSEFPVLTKSILMERFDEIVTVSDVTKRGVAGFLSRSKDPRELFLGKYRVIHTSGSSGEVGYFVFSAQDWKRGRRTGRRPGQPRQPRHRGPARRIKHGFYGATDGHYAGATMFSTFRHNLVAKLSTDIGLFEVNAPLGETIRALNGFQPD